MIWVGLAHRGAAAVFGLCVGLGAWNITVH